MIQLLSMMKFTDKHLKILVTLSDEAGYSTTSLADIIEGDKEGKGNISKILGKMISNSVIENLQPKTHFHDYNLHIKKEMVIFISIIFQLDEKYNHCHLESVKYGEKFKMLEKRGGWADNRMITLISEIHKHSESYQSSEELLVKFRCSEYTGEIIKKYKIKDTLNAIPMMTVDDYIRFVDWADENKFTKSEDYMEFIFSLSDNMIKQFEKKSQKFAENLDSAYNGDQYIHNEEGQDMD
jgi:hypothetical protein